VTASIGVAVALGFWTAAAMTTLIALASLLLLRPMERVVLRSLRKGVCKVVLDLDSEGRLAKVSDVLDRRSVNVRRMKTVGEPDESRQVIMSLELPSELDIEELLGVLRGLDHVTSVDWSR